jgi:hypothetical protein
VNAATTLTRARRRPAEALSNLADALRGRPIPTWLLGGLVALLSWKPQFGMPGVGLDASWNAGLQMAADRGLEFGSEVVFTYGPLGFLRSTTLWHDDLAILAFLYSAAIYVALCISLVWALRRPLGTLGAALVAFFAVALLPSIEQPLLITTISCMALLAREPSRYGVEALVVGGATLAAVETSIRLSPGPAIFAICLLALIGARARWWHLLGYVALFAAELLLLWIVAGQSLGDLPDYVAHAQEIVSGYSEAMGVNLSPDWQGFAAALALVALVGAAAAGGFRDALARGSAIGVVALAGFVAFKQGIVRFEPNHVAFYFSTVCALWLAIPRPPAQRPLLLFGALVLAALATHALPPSGANVDVIGNLKRANAGVRDLLDAGRRAEIADEGRQVLKDIYRLDPRILAELRGYSVSVDPWEVGAAWAYDLEWSPLPVFQNYSAYTDELDELNAAEVRSPTGPERILRENPALVDAEYPTRTIDGRYPGWDPPAQSRAVLCHFVPVHTTTRWQVLARTADRCGRPELVRSTEASAAEAVEVPSPGPGEVVFARVHGVEVDGLERVRALLFRPRFRYAVLDEKRVYRLVPGTAENGLLLRSSGGAAGGDGPFAQVPQAETIELTGASGPLRLDFFTMPVRPPAVGRRQ